MSRTKWWAVVTASLALFGCERREAEIVCDGEGTEASVGVTEGIAGRVCLWRGDFMPSSPPATGRVIAASRTVFVHELTHRSHLVPPSVEVLRYSAVRSRVVDSAQSGIDGFFEVAVRPGRYSVLVRDRGLYYPQSVGW